MLVDDRNRTVDGEWHLSLEDEIRRQRASEVGESDLLITRNEESTADPTSCSAGSYASKAHEESAQKDTRHAKGGGQHYL